MSLSPNNINELRESFDYLVQQNYEVQDEVNNALRSGKYWKAVRAIDNYMKLINDFIKKASNMAQKFKDNANERNAAICLKAEKMAQLIKTAHIEVEENILKKYIKKG
jgi:hypothetical protein